MSATPPESDVAGAAMEWLIELGFDCYPEVQLHSGGRRADIVGVDDRIVWAVEVKIGATLKLIEQAVGWVRHAHRVSIATWRYPSPMVQTICKSFGIGVLLCRKRYATDGEQWSVEEVLAPRLNRKAAGQYFRDALHEDMKRYKPGGTAMDGFSSPWKRTMAAAKAYIKENPGCGLKDLTNGIKHHYQSNSSAISSLRKWLDTDAEVEIQTDGRKHNYYLAGTTPEKLI